MKPRFTKSEIRVAAHIEATLQKGAPVVFLTKSQLASLRNAAAKIRRMNAAKAPHKPVNPLIN